jgi:hypothetical protein
MANKNLDIRSIVGKTRNDVLIRIPVKTSREALLNLIATWTLDDKIDVFCMLEYILYRRSSQRKYDDHESLAFIYDRLLHDKSLQTSELAMTELGLFTSIDRLKRGEKLSL